MPTPTPGITERPSSRRDTIFLSQRLKRLRYITARLDTQQGLEPPWLIASFVLALLLIFLRDPSLFTRPQFWAEDGKVWYAEAYNQGWLHALAHPLNGYLSTLPRLGAAAALLVAFRWAPLVMALEGLLFQALPVPILLSERCRNWAPLSFRLLFAAVYIAIPNAREVHVLCTNCQWHLAVIMALLAFAAAPHSLFGRIFDIVLFALGAVSGPFALVLLPLLLVFWWTRRQRWSMILSSILAAGIVVQLALLRGYNPLRYTRVLGATPERLIRIVGGNIFWAALRGSRAYGFEHSLLPCLFAFIIGVAIIVSCSRRSSLEVRLFFLFAFGILAASLARPLLPPTPGPLWEGILQTASIRYWFFPSLIFLWSLLWCACYSPSGVSRATGILLSLVLVQGILRDWSVPPLEDLHFAQYAAQVEAAPSGTLMKIPLNPPTAWSMEITKK